MKRRKDYFGILCVVVVIFLFLLSIRVVEIGIPKFLIAARERKEQSIPDDWSVMTAENDGVFAVCFYEETGSTFKLYVYTRHTGGIGYFFDTGGSFVTLDGTRGRTQERRIYSWDGQERIILASMNGDGVAQIQIQLEDRCEVLEIDESKPFVAILPAGCERYWLTDGHGETLPVNS